MGVGAKVVLPDAEVVAALVHIEWMSEQRNRGVSSVPDPGGEELMVPFDQLSDAGKGLVRRTVEAVYAAIQAAT